MSWLFLFTHLLAMLLVTGTPYYCYEDKCICDGNHADCSGHHHMDFIPRLPKGVTSVVISYNGVTRIDSAGFFVNVTHITSLVMSLTGLTYIAPGAFDILDNLTSLDISFNFLKKIPENTFSKATRQRLQQLDASGNYFRCDCDLTWLARWLVSSPSVFKNSYDDPYTCIDEFDSTRRDIVELNSMDKQVCLMSKTAAVLIIAFTSMFLAVFVCVILYRIYCKRSATNQDLAFKLFRNGLQRLVCLTNVPFRYDIFMSYAEEDKDLVFNHLMPELEGRLGLRLCVHQRDFHPGRNILDNIEDCVESSKKVMMIFSTHFAHSPWCQFELSLCQRHAMERHDELVVVHVNNTPDCELTPSMAAIMRTSTYISWSQQDAGNAFFWNRLRVALRGVILPRQPQSRRPHPLRHREQETEIV